MKCWAIIAYFAMLKGLRRKVAIAKRVRVAGAPRFEGFSTKPNEALSKGTGQKVQVLAAIAHDPEFGILDEPFAGLDPVNQQVMADISSAASTDQSR